MPTTHETALRTKHDSLERRIREEMSRPSPDDATLKQLKLKKLRIKEELTLN